MMKPVDIEALRAIVGEHNVLTSPEELYTYSYDGTATWKHLPDLVLLPENAEQISRILNYANKYRIPVTARGGGTNVSGGSVPIEGGIVLVTTRMNRILEISKDNLHAIAEPGVILGEFNRELAKQGLYFPPDPQSFDGCTLGGAVAENSGGPSCLKYGVTKQYVLGMEVALADGRLLKLGGLTPKNRTGYELAMLFTGSEGTLGVITKLNLRLIPAPKAHATIVAVFDDIAVAGQTVSDIIAGTVLPSKCEFIDKWTFDKFRGILPVDVLDASEVILLIQLDGLPETVAAETRTVEETAGKSARFIRVTETQAEADGYWAARRAHFSDISNQTHTLVNEDVSVPRDKIAEFIRRAQDSAKKYDVPLSIAGHVGDGNFHPAVLSDVRDKDHYGRAMKCVEEIIRTALELRGVLSGEHGIGLEKKQFLKLAMDPQAIDIMREIKDLLDPNHILNPGKIWEPPDAEG